MKYEIDNPVKTWYFQFIFNGLGGLAISDLISSYMTFNITKILKIKIILSRNVRFILTSYSLPKFRFSSPVGVT